MRGGGGEWKGGWGRYLVEPEYSGSSPLPFVINRAGKIWLPTLLPLSSVTLSSPLSPAKVWRPLVPLSAFPGSPVAGRIHHYLCLLWLEQKINVVSSLALRIFSSIFARFSLICLQLAVFFYCLSNNYYCCHSFSSLTPPLPLVLGIPTTNNLRHCSTSISKLNIHN